MSTYTQELWNRCLDELKEAGDFIDSSIVSADSPEVAKQAVDYLFMTLSSAYLLMARSDPDYPEFKPWVNHQIRYGAPNPDATYYYAAISGEGIYRIHGYRNSVFWVDFLTGYDFWGFTEKPGKSFPSQQIDSFAINDDGSFEILLSKERPAGHHGNWIKLDPDANYLVIRQFAYHPEELDIRMGIERVDRPLSPTPRPLPDAGELVRKVIGHVKTSARAWPSFPRWLKVHPPNTFNVFPLKGTGEVQGQVYYETLYELPLDQTMLIEFRVPEKCTYWNIQIDDRFWRTLEFVNRHTHINGRVDRSDSDGIVRVVVCHHDPGVANWVDACGVTEGHILIRFQNVDAKPPLDVKLVPITDIDKHLPADTRRVTPEEREASLRKWAMLRQQRRSW